MGGVGGELDAPLGVEPLDRLQQADRRHLDQVVEGLAPVGEPASQVAGEGEVPLDQPGRRLLAAGLDVEVEEPAELLAAGCVERHQPCLVRMRKPAPCPSDGASSV